MHIEAIQTPKKPSSSSSSSSVESSSVPVHKRGEEEDDVKEAYPFEKEYKDYQTGYASVPGLAYENQGWVTEVEGEIPNEMEGTLLRNGPAMYEREGFIKSYLDGDGMVTSVAVKDGKAYFRNKFVVTEDFDEEERTGKYIKSSIFTAEDPRPFAFGQRLFKDLLGGDISKKQNGAYNVIN